MCYFLRFTNLVVTAAAVALCASCQTTQTAAMTPDEMRKLIAQVTKTYDVPGIAVARIQNGEPVWIVTHGKTSSGPLITDDTAFNVASLTKPLFATMVLHATQSTEFSLDGSLAEHWVDPDVADEPKLALLTARLALSHQSGFPNWRGRNALRFMFTPGERHEYSGEGFEYVRRALEKTTGQSMQDLMAEYVTAPANMTNTVFGWNGSLSAKFAGGFDEVEDALETASVESRIPNAAASTFTTVVDVANFLGWVSKGAGLAEASLSEMTTPQAIHENPAENFSIGWRVSTVNGTPVISHDGREPGVRTLMILDPSHQEGIVILTNSSNGELVTRPIVSSGLSYGDQFLLQSDRDLWRFFRLQPSAAYQPMLTFIAKSPSFTEKLLNAVHTNLVIESGLNVAMQKQSEDAVARFVIAHHQGLIDAEGLDGLLANLNIGDQESFQLVERFDRTQAVAWIAGLSALINGD